ncbi:MAG: hypothetical protein H0W83_06220 [Planctomycetes bacterium]|nr:hypothetical protein [Planctomycetota bacterium]
MNAPPAPLTCSTCASPISPDDLLQGLAVKVDGQLVCHMCVDNLPGKAQVEINRFRALKGLSSTTYLVPDARHPGHQRFSFTTAGNVVIHRRTLRDTGSFTAPPLPATPPPLRQPSSAANRAASSPANPLPHASASPARPSRQGFRIAAIVGGSVVALFAIIAVWATLRSTAPKRALPIPSGAAVTATPLPVRGDYPVEPLAGWRAAAADPRCPDSVRSAIGDEVRAVYDRALDTLTTDFELGHQADVRSGLDRLQIIDDRAFTESKARRDELRAQLPSDPPAKTDIIPLETTDPDPAPVVQVPSAPAGPECWTFTGIDLLAGRKQPNWNANAELIGIYGTLERDLPPLHGGSYQVWVRAVNPSGRGSLSLLLGDLAIGKASAAECGTGAWFLVAPAAVVAAGPSRIVLRASSGPGWRIGDIYLAGSDRQGPQDNPEASAPAWPVAAVPAPVPTPAPTVADPPPGKAHEPVATKPVVSTRAITDWRRVFIYPLEAKPEPFDGNADIPNPWPSGAEPFQRSQKPNGANRLQQLVIEIPKASVAAGGVVALLHRVAANRKSLNVSVESAGAPPNAKSEPVDKGVSIMLEPLKFNPESSEWQTFAIQIPDLERFGPKLWLKFEDESSIERGFLLGKVVTVANGPPEVDDIDLMPAPLVASDINVKEYQHKLVVLLDRVAALRPTKKWMDQRLYDPRKIKLLVTNADKTWETEMRKQLTRVLGREPGKGTIENLGIAESWYPEQQFKATTPLVNAEETTLVAICLNGEEATCSLKDPDNLVKWVRNLVNAMVNGDKNRRGGFLPVVVIGRTTKVDEASQAVISAAWPRVREDCAAMGIPLIDIRNAQRVTLKHDVRELSAQLLADGLRTLVYQITWAQKKFVK